MFGVQGRGRRCGLGPPGCCAVAAGRGPALLGSLSAILALLLYLAPGYVFAFDPQTRWLTMTTPRFSIHYPAGYDDHALHVGRAAEWAYGALSDQLAWSVGGVEPAGPDIHIVISDEQDFAQGFARTTPYPLITINLAAPGPVESLSDYDDWLAGLVVHELAHIFHIDTVGPVPAFLNSIFGKQLTPNGAQARWFVEGLATHFESRLSRGGRVRSKYIAAILRSQVLAQRMPSLGELTGTPSRWPGGSMAYIYGGRFLSYLQHRFGPSTLAQISRDYGGRLLPWAMNLSAERATGESYAALYDDFRQRLLQEAQAVQATVHRRGLRRGLPLTAIGGRTGPPRLGQTGEIFFLCDTASDLPVLCLLRQGNGRLRRLARAQRGSSIALDPSRGEVLMSELEVSDTYYLYRDFYRLNLADGSRQRLSYGGRTGQPDISTDGKQVVFSQARGVHSVLRLADYPDLSEAHIVADLGPLTQVWSPRFSADGRRVVFSGHRGGQRDLFLVPLGNGSGRPRVQQLTDSTAFEGGPSFSADGSTVLFHSDRSGIFNLYALHLASGRVTQLSDVVSGAFDPVATAEGDIVYRHLGAEGFDLALLPSRDRPLPLASESGSTSADHLRPATEDAQEPGRVVGTEEVSPAQPVVDPFLPPHAAQVPGASLLRFPSNTYSPWPTLLPQAWTPVWSSDPLGSTIGATVKGSDAVGLHRYAIEASYGLTSGQPNIRLNYQNSQFFPGVSVRAARILGLSAVPVRQNGSATTLVEKNTVLSLTSRWPLAVTRRTALHLSTGWAVRHRSPLIGERRLARMLDPLAGNRQQPNHGRFASVDLSLRLSHLQRTDRAVSVEKGFSAAVGVVAEDPVVGSQYSALRFVSAVVAYVPMPWSGHFRHHVLALRTDFAFGKSNYPTRGLFIATGLAIEDPLLQLLGLAFRGTGELRGFPLATLVGDAKVSGTLEYRFPLVRPEHGFGTLPLYNDYISGALFLDFASVADVPGHLIRGPLGNDNFDATAGAELRAALLLGYGLFINARLGWGVVLTRDLSPRAQHRFYLNLGTPF